jgi:hypothetical protein
MDRPRSHDIIVKQHGGSIAVETELGLSYGVQDRIAADGPKVKYGAPFSPAD